MCFIQSTFSRDELIFFVHDILLNLSFEMIGRWLGSEGFQNLTVCGCDSEFL